MRVLSGDAALTSILSRRERKEEDIGVQIPNLRQCKKPTTITRPGNSKRHTNNDLDKGELY
jgi:hypothetical protein